jgi:uncharacterized protein (TIGR03437 family)
MAVLKQFKYADLTDLAYVLSAFLLFSSSANSQTMAVSTNWLTAASGTEPVEITLAHLSPSVYQLLSEGAIAVRWNGQILPTQVISNDSLQFTVPPALRVPGLTEFVLWDSKAHQPLPFRAWISVIIPTVAEVFEADPASNRVVAAVGGDGTASGTGGKISVYSLTSGALQSTVPVPGSQRVLAFTPDTQYAWLAVDEKQGKVARLNLSSQQIDEPLQAVGGGPLSAEVFRRDPRIVIVESGGGTYAYLNGALLPNAAPPFSSVPFPVDANGRLLTTLGQTCDMDAGLGFINCVAVLPGNRSSWQAVWKNKAATQGGVTDLTTGANLLTLYDFLTVNYLPENNRVVFTSGTFDSVLIGDGDSLEMFVNLVGAIPLQVEGLRRIWAPDWFLIRAEATLPTFDLFPGILIGHMPQLGPAPTLTAQGIVNAATDISGPIAPGEIVSLFGQNLGPADGAGPVMDDGLLFATEVEQTKLLFNGVQAAILYAAPGQINAVVPESVQQSDSTLIQVVHYGIPSPQVQAQVAAYSPGIFTYLVGGKAYAAATNSDGIIQGPGSPLRRGTVATFYATGVGIALGETAESIAARPSPLATFPSISIGGMPAQVIYAGVSPGLTAALTQINVMIPAGAPAGNAVEVVIAAGGQSQGNVWAAIQ